MNAQELALKVRQHLMGGNPTPAEWEEYKAEFKALEHLERINCWTIITIGDGPPVQPNTPEWEENLRVSKVAHHHLVDLLLECFGVPRGEAGVGVKPTFPPGLRVD